MPSYRLKLITWSVPGVGARGERRTSLQAAVCTPAPAERSAEVVGSDPGVPSRDSCTASQPLPRLEQRLEVGVFLWQPVLCVICARVCRHLELSQG